MINKPILCLFDSADEYFKKLSEYYKYESARLGVIDIFHRKNIRRVSHINAVIRIEDEQLNRLIDHLKSQIVNESFD